MTDDNASRVSAIRTRLAAARALGVAHADAGDTAWLLERVAAVEAERDAISTVLDADVIDTDAENRALRERVATLTKALAFIDQEADHQMERAYDEKRGRQGTAFHHLRNVARIALAGAADGAAGGGGDR